MTKAQSLARKFRETQMLFVALAATGKSRALIEATADTAEAELVRILEEMAK